MSKVSPFWYGPSSWETCWSFNKKILSGFQPFVFKRAKNQDLCIYSTKSLVSHQHKPGMWIQVYAKSIPPLSKFWVTFEHMGWSALACILWGGKISLVRARSYQTFHWSQLAGSSRRICLDRFNISLKLLILLGCYKKHFRQDLNLFNSLSMN